MSTSAKDKVSHKEQDSSVDSLYNGYIDYGSTVVKERALTSLMDGLKLGQRRALLCMTDPAYKNKWVSTLALLVTQQRFTIMAMQLSLVRWRV